MTRSALEANRSSQETSAPRNLSIYLHRAAIEFPDRTAVVDASGSLTYRELDTLSSQIANILRDRGVQRGDRVAILMPKSTSAVASILGILKAQAVYVPLDPGSPAPRLLRMLDNSDGRWILASGTLSGRVREIFDHAGSGSWAVGWLDRPPNLDLSHPADSFMPSDLADASPAWQPEGTPEDLAYIMFTSGSTGVPKGVMITHANVAAFVEWATSYFAIGPEDRISGHSPFAFDLSVFDIFGTLRAGACLFLVPAGINVLAPKIAEFIREHELTQWFSVPSVLNYLAQSNSLEQEDFPALKRLLFCGEVLPTPTLRYLMERLPHVQFTNLYGPTEATIASSYHTVCTVPASSDEDIPIGVPCGGEGLHVLTEGFERTPVGERGELYLSGVGLSPGYWRDLSETEQAFLTPPPETGLPGRLYRTGDITWRDEEGLLRFVGRVDTQVKSRGYRIELGEVEAALLALSHVHEAAVVAVPTTGFEGSRLCCTYVGKEDADRVRSDLREVLPAYMIPSEFRKLQELPLNANGKVDRPALANWFHERVLGEDR